MFVGHERFADVAAEAAAAGRDRSGAGSRSATVPGFAPLDDARRRRPTAAPTTAHRGRADALHVGHDRQAQGRGAAR